MKEPTGGCCVCLDDRGWSENKLVYCDGHGCNVAVHQACYGITRIPQGSWFCRKCESQERVARVKCELCPSKEGALKRTDTGGWAHVVCALYVPEVLFGDDSTMEPILISRVSRDKYGKVCYLCAQQNRQAEAGCGACIKCARSSCRIVFHVTCGQSADLLREEPNGPGSSTYNGYCNLHVGSHKPSSLQLYSSTLNAGTIHVDSQQHSQEESLDSQLSTDAMSQDGDSQFDVTGEGESSDSMVVQGLKLNVSTTPTKAHLAAKGKRSVAAKANAKSVRHHQRGLKRGRNGKTLPSTKKQKTDKESEECKPGSVDKDDMSIVGNSTNTSTSTIDWSSSNGIESHDNQTDPVVNSQREEQVLPSSVLPSTLEEFLDQQWKRGHQFLVEELGQCDASSLVETLKRLKAENNELSKQISELAQQKERLLAVNRNQPLPVASETETAVASSTETAGSSSKPTDSQTTEKTLNDKDLVLYPPPTELQSQAKEKTPVEASPVSKSPSSSLQNSERSHPPVEGKDEGKTPMKAKGASKSQSSVAPKSSEKIKRSPKGKAKMTKGGKVTSETQRLPEKKNRIPTKNLTPEKVCIIPESSSLIPLNATESVTVAPLSVPSAPSVCTITSAASKVTSSVPASSLADIIELSEIKLPHASQMNVAPKKKRRAPSEKGKKTNIIMAVDQSTTPSQQLTTGHSVSSLLGDQSHTHSSFYPVLPPLLPDRTSSASFTPVASIHSPLYYSQHPLVYSSARPVPQQTAFSTEYVTSSSPSGVLGMPSGLGMHSLTGSMPAFFPNRST